MSCPNMMSVEILHPMTVHFPIALLLASFVSETVALVFKVPSWHRISFWNLLFGTWGALAAVITGGIAATAARHGSVQSYQTQRGHELVGSLAFAMAVMALSWHLAVGKEMRRTSRWIAWGWLGLTCAVIALASHLGGRLVYEFKVMGAD